jgi:hypothetical protein
VVVSWGSFFYLALRVGDDGEAEGDVGQFVNAVRVERQGKKVKEVNTMVSLFSAYEVIISESTLLVRQTRDRRCSVRRKIRQRTR